jgi:hypothetical protein
VLSSTVSIDDGNNTFNDSARMVLTSVAHVPQWAGWREVSSWTSHANIQRPVGDPLAGTGGVRVGTGQLCGRVNRRRFAFWDDETGLTSPAAG